MSDITIYYNPYCVVSRNALTLIRHAGIEPTVIDYLRTRPSREKLLELLATMQAPVRALVRVHSPYGADLGLYDPAWTDDALLDLVLERPALLNRPTGFILPVRGLVPSVGAGFVVALCGEVSRMPGLGKTPAFHNIDIDEQGNTVGLF